MKDNHIQYIELQAINLDKIKEFYSTVFGWTFVDYGKDYVAFENGGIDGGFSKVNSVTRGGPLVILYHKKLKLAKEKVIKGGGKIVKDIFSFPGGSRFHFIDPSGNELAIWSEK